MPNRQFIAIWHSEGLEHVEDVTAAERGAFLQAIREGSAPNCLSKLLQSAILRAQFNPQRHYEIYSITAVSGITTRDIVKMFNASPQTAADTIRRLGYKLYSNRRQTQKEVIT